VRLFLPTYLRFHKFGSFEIRGGRTADRKAAAASYLDLQYLLHYTTYTVRFLFLANLRKVQANSARMQSFDGKIHLIDLRVVPYANNDETLINHKCFVD